MPKDSLMKPAKLRGRASRTCSGSLHQTSKIARLYSGSGEPPMTEINLRPFLRPQLDVLFVALNPPAQSNHNGHYFSGRGSRFFHLLYLSGLITQDLPKETADTIVFGAVSRNPRFFRQDRKASAGAGIRETDVSRHARAQTQSSDQNRDKRVRETVSDCISDRKPRP